MTARRRTLTRLAVATALTCGLVAAGSVTAFAAPTTTVTSSPTDRATALCARADHLRGRLEKALGRIQAGADQQGSVAWLRARAAKATSANHADLAATLTARADRREKRVPEIEAALARLASATAGHCGAGATPSSL